MIGFDKIDGKIQIQPIGVILKSGCSKNFEKFYKKLSNVRYLPKCTKNKFLQEKTFSKERYVSKIYFQENKYVSAI